MKTITILNSMKSGYFMLVACVTLLLGATACSNEEFGMEVPEAEKVWTKQELIELALSRMTPTSDGSGTLAMMTTEQQTVYIKGYTKEDIEISFNSDTVIQVLGNTYFSYDHTFSNGDSYVIALAGSFDALEELDVRRNDIDFLFVSDNTQLKKLDCGSNKLAEITWDNCPNLRWIDAAYNDFSSIDVSHFPNLDTLWLEANQLTNLDVTNNPNLELLWLNSNPITNIDLTNNTALKDLSLKGLSSLQTLNNRPLCDTSFAIFPQLEELCIAYTPFSSLDLSRNPLLIGLSMFGTDITELNLSNLQIEYLYASYSQLTNIICTRNSLEHAHFFQIEDTPFENNRMNLLLFAGNLPDRSTKSKGYLYTTSPYINNVRAIVNAKNWEVISLNAQTMQYLPYAERNRRMHHLLQ